ncbi:MAG: hypothetical protein U1F57_11280 [bacterium]
MPTSENLQRLIDDLRRNLEAQREAGLLPPYLWMPADPSSAASVSTMPPSAPVLLSEAKTPEEPKGSPASAPENVNAMTSSDPSVPLQNLREKIGDCTRCRLHQGRTKLVFGVGNPRRNSCSSGKARAETKT